MAFRSKTALRNRAEVISAEFGAGVGHLENAAGTAAQAAVQTLAPRVAQAREAVKPRFDQVLAGLTPMVEAAVEAATEAQKTSAKSAQKWEKNGRRNAKRAAGEAKRRTTNAALALQGQKTRRRWPLVMGALAIGAAVGAAASALLARRETVLVDDFGFPLTPDEQTAAAEKTADAAKEAAAKVSSAADKTLNGVTAATNKTKSTADKAAQRVAERVNGSPST
jgi:hypothetical protein